MKKIASLYPLLISIFTIFVAVLAYLQGISFLDLMELKTIDLRFEARGQIPPVAGKYQANQNFICESVFAQAWLLWATWDQKHAWTIQ